MEELPLSLSKVVHGPWERYQSCWAAPKHAGAGQTTPVCYPAARNLSVLGEMKPLAD